MTNHPSLEELRDALLRGKNPTEIQDHLASCLACRIAYSRIAQIDGMQSPATDSVQRIVDASEVVPGIHALADAVVTNSPESGELWRVGRSEAQLAWVRNNLHDGAVDVVPVVLDVELADEYSLLVPASASPLSANLAAVVTLRTHVHQDAFIDRIGRLDITSDIEEVIAAQREGRSSLADVGPKIEIEDDERLEYRQALRDLLADLSPSVWLTSAESAEQTLLSDSRYKVLKGDSQWFEREVTERLPSARCFQLEQDRFEFGSNDAVAAFVKVAYLDTAVVVVTVESLERAQTSMSALASACDNAVRSSPDADAICVTERGGDWTSVLFSRASLRHAVELPTGNEAGPVPVIAGLGVMDTLWKHLEGSISAWEATENAPGGLGSVDVASMATRHVHASIGSIESQGQRAIQEAKKATWATLPPGLADQVSRFVTAVTGSVPPQDALDDFERKARSDPNSEAE